MPDVDGVLIGPHDLSCSLGVPEDFASDEFQQAVKTIFQKARAAGVGAGIHQVSGWQWHVQTPNCCLQGMPPTTPGMTPEFATKWISEYGCNVYVHAADVNLFSTQVGSTQPLPRWMANTCLGAVENPPQTNTW